MISQLSWFENVPSHWKLLPIKRVVATKVTDGPHETPIILDEGIPFISAEAIKNHEVNFNFKRGYISLEDHESFCRKCKPQRDDIFMVKSGATTGKLAIVKTDEEFSIWSPLALIRADQTKITPRFLFYTLLDSRFQQQVELSWSFGTQQNIGMGIIENLSIPIPPLEEQQRIAAYLDRETARIDELRAEKERFLQLLDEKRAAVIAHAVSGRSVRLYLRKAYAHLSHADSATSSTRTKPSGVAWLGDVPEYWDVVPLFAVMHEVKNKNICNIEKNVLSLSYGNIIRRNVENNAGLLPESFETYQIVERGTIVLRLTDLQNDKKSLRVGLVKERGIITSAYFSLKTDVRFAPEFVFYLLHFYDQLKIFYDLGDGVRQSMNFDDLRRLPLLLPPIEEQRAIVEYLECALGEIDELKRALLHSLDLLSQRRAALIAEAVTGRWTVHG